MGEFRKSLSNLTRAVKILLSILWGLYGFLFRLTAAIDKNDMLGVIIAVLIFVFTGWLFIFIDIYCILVNGEVWSMK